MPQVRCVTNGRNLTLGGTLRRGFEAATKDLVFYTDADLPFDVGLLTKAVRLLRFQEADLVVAYRFHRTEEGPLRALYSFFYNSLVRMLLKIRVRDVNFSFKLFRRDILPSLALKSDGSFIDAELVGKTLHRGYRMIQFGVDYFPRSIGVSKLSSLKVIRKILPRVLPPAQGSRPRRSERGPEAGARNRDQRHGNALMPAGARGRAILARYAKAGVRDRGHVATRLRSVPFAAVLDALPATGLVASFGCGHAAIEIGAALESPARSILAADIDARKLAVAREAAAGLRIEVVEGDVLAILVARGLAPSAILVVDVLYLVDDAGQRNFFRRAKTALGPGALLVVKEMDERPRWKAA